MLLKIPTDLPKDRPTRPVRMHYGTMGTVLKIHLTPSLYTALLDTKLALEMASGQEFSQTILMRKALTEYAMSLKGKDHESLHAEAMLLKRQYR